MVKTNEGNTAIGVDELAPAGTLPPNLPPHLDRLYLGAPAIARRLFGSAAEKYCRIIYHWRELPAERRPEFLKDVGGRPAAWESGIQKHAAATPA